MTEIEKFLLPYHPTVDCEGRLHIYCICDGTLLFALHLQEVLETFGCTEIKIDSKLAEEREIPKDKLWCSCKYIASGLLPKLNKS